MLTDRFRFKSLKAGVPILSYRSRQLEQRLAFCGGVELTARTTTHLPCFNMLSESSSKGRERSDNNNFSVQSPIKKRRRRRRGGEEEEPVLRTTCDNCTSAKVK